jgi:hypothetical protein
MTLRLRVSAYNGHLQGGGYQSKESLIANYVRDVQI